MLDLTEPSAMEPGAAPAGTKTSVSASASSTSPTRVDVPCASMRPTAAGSRPGRAPGAFDRQALPDGVRRGDALALAVAGRPDATQHGVDPVAVAFGVGEALEHEHGRALAHHEPVRARVERPGPGRRQGTDLAELDEAVDAHVAVDAAA